MKFCNHHAPNSFWLFYRNPDSAVWASFCRSFNIKGVATLKKCLNSMLDRQVTLVPGCFSSKRISSTALVVKFSPLTTIFFISSYSVILYSSNCSCPFHRLFTSQRDPILLGAPCLSFTEGVLGSHSIRFQNLEKQAQTSDSGAGTQAVKLSLTMNLIFMSKPTHRLIKEFSDPKFAAKLLLFRFRMSQHSHSLVIIVNKATSNGWLHYIQPNNQAIQIKSVSWLRLCPACPASPCPPRRSGIPGGTPWVSTCSRAQSSWEP